MNRLQLTRPHFFIPKEMQDALRTSHGFGGPAVQNPASTPLPPAATTSTSDKKDSAPVENGLPFTAPSASDGRPSYLSQGQMAYLQSEILPRLAADFPGPHQRLARTQAPKERSAPNATSTLSTSGQDARPLPPNSIGNSAPVGKGLPSRASRASDGRSSSPASSTSSNSSTSAPSPSPRPTTNTKSPASSRCSYQTSDGRRCRMLVGKDHPELCSHHAQQELRSLERSVAQPLARQILGTLTDLRSGTGVNHALANLFILSADGRVSARRSSNLTYIAQLLVQSLAAIRHFDWRGDPAPSVEQAQRATLIAPLSPPDDEADVAQGD